MHLHTKIFMIIFCIECVLSFLAIITTEYTILNGAYETNLSAAYEQALYGRPISYILFFGRRLLLLVFPIGGYFVFRSLLHNKLEIKRLKFKKFETRFCDLLPLILPLGVFVTIMLITIPDVYNNLQVCWYFINGGF